MNEFEFICRECGQLSDDGDIPKRICMGCDDHLQVMNEVYYADGELSPHLDPEIMKEQRRALKIEKKLRGR